MQIEIREYVYYRITKGHGGMRENKCHDFEVVVTNAPAVDFTALKVEGFVNGVERRDERAGNERKAERFARGLADAIGYEGEIVRRTFGEKIIREWEEVI